MQRIHGRLFRLLAFTFLLPCTLVPLAAAGAEPAGLRLAWEPRRPGDGQPLAFVLRGAAPDAAPVGDFLDQKLAFAWSKRLRAHVALAAVPLGTKPKRHPVAVRVGTGEATDSVTEKVQTRWVRYPTAEVRLRERPKGETGVSEKDKVAGEKPVSGGKLVKQALARETAERHWTLPLQRPLSSKVTEHFGVRRTYLRLRGKKVLRRWKGRHMGLDLDGDGGEPIGAVAGGEVVVAGYYFGMGKAVLLDHGQRFFTAYFHMSRVGVKVGQRVRRGETLGLVGATGLATGPHLHLTARINGARVDPLALLALLSPRGRSEVAPVAGASAPAPAPATLAPAPAATSPRRD